MKVAVIGAGSWGTAFSLHLSRRGLKPQLWVREPEILEMLKSRRENSVFLPGYELPPSVSFTDRLEEVVAPAEIIFVAVPSRYCRQLYTAMAPSLRASQVVVSLTKGIEEGSLQRMTEIMAEVFPVPTCPQLAVLSGPSFAREVAERHPTAVVVASADLSVAASVQHLVADESFRVYASQDVVASSWVAPSRTLSPSRLESPMP